MEGTAHALRVGAVGERRLGLAAAPRSGPACARKRGEPADGAAVVVDLGDAPAAGVYEATIERPVTPPLRGDGTEQ